MESKTIRLDSRFMKVVMFFSVLNEYQYRHREWNTCSLWRHVLFVFLFWLPVKTIACSVFIGFAVYAINRAGFLIFNLFIEVPAEVWYFQIIYVLTTCVLFSALVVGIGVCGMAWDKRKERLANQGELAQGTKAAGPLLSMYRSWKEKTCSRIEFK